MKWKSAKKENKWNLFVINAYVKKKYNEFKSEIAKIRLSIKKNKFQRQKNQS